MSQMSPKDARTLIAGISICAALIAVTKGVPAQRAWESSAREELEQFTRTADRLELTARVRAVVSETLRVRKARLADVDSALLAGDTPEGAAGELAAIVTNSAENSDVRLGSMRLRTDSLHRKGRYVRVSVIANATGDSQGIMSMLAELEAEIPVLAIRELILSQPEPGGPSDRPEAIRMDITIEGIARNPLPRFMVPRSPRGGAR